MYLDRSSMTSFAAERLATDSYNKLVSHKGGPFEIVFISPIKVIVEENGISITISIDDITLVPTLMTVQDVMDDANSGNKNGLPNEAMQENVNLKDAMRHNVIYDNEEGKEDVSGQSGTERRKAKKRKAKA